jgi:hypothetical protein
VLGRGGGAPIYFVWCKALVGHLHAHASPHSSPACFRPALGVPPRAHTQPAQSAAVSGQQRPRCLSLTRPAYHARAISRCIQGVSQV